MFTPAQLKMLDAPASSDGMKTRKVGSGNNARTVWYLPGQECKRRLNAAFGPGLWDREIMDSGYPWVGKVSHKGRNGDTYENHGVTASARVRLTVRGESGHECVHEDVGYCTAEASIYGAPPFEMAAKGAVTDALKRCAHAFGNMLGLALYDPDDLTGEIASERMAALTGGEKPRNLDHEKTAEFLPWVASRVEGMAPKPFIRRVCEQEIGQPTIDDLAQFDAVRDALEAGRYEWASGERIPEGVGR